MKHLITTLSLVLLSSCTPAHAQTRESLVACAEVASAWTEVANTGRLHDLELAQWQAKTDEDGYKRVQTVFRNAPQEPDNAYKLGWDYCMNNKPLK